MTHTNITQTIMPGLSKYSILKKPPRRVSIWRPEQVECYWTRRLHSRVPNDSDQSRVKILMFIERVTETLSG